MSRFEAAPAAGNGRYGSGKLGATLWSAAILCAVGVCFSVSSPAADPGVAAGDDPSSVIDSSYVKEIDDWHEWREQRLLREDGWLSLVGLHTLDDGVNTFGSDSETDLAFPSKAPALAGRFIVEEGRVTLEAQPGSGIMHDGEPVTSLVVRSDAEGDPTVVEMGSLLFYVIDRDGQLYVRLKDRKSPLLESFEGIDRYPVDARWRVEASWEPYDPPRHLQIPTILGTISNETCYGALVFELEGRPLRLDAVGDPDGELFIIFGDRTNGVETYSGGRYIYTEPPGSDGAVNLDFNKAYNPPCVFTPYATCPFPPAQNKLPLRITAGEKMYGETHGTEH
jgi:uncharacterized protein (DUF1684 family)